VGGLPLENEGKGILEGSPEKIFRTGAVCTCTLELYTLVRGKVN